MLRLRRPLVRSAARIGCTQRLCRPALARRLHAVNGGGAAGAAAEDVDTFFAVEQEPKLKANYLLPRKYRTEKKRSQYILGKELGSGVFATVYQAVDRDSGRKVAVKVMCKATTPKELCERELAILDQVADNKVHSRINTIYDVYETETQLCIVLELMAGDLFEHVANSGRLSEPEAAKVIRKLLYALDALHRSGILHRDIKLENLLIEQQNEDDEESGRGADQFKLADFGYAKRIGEQDRFRNPAGTLGYAAPEVLEKREYGPACDVWSAGVVLYIMLAGHPPFPTKEGVDTSNMTIDEQLELEAEAIHHGREKDRWNKHFQSPPWDTVSLPAKRLLSKMLRIDPSKRFTTSQILNDPWILKNTKVRQYEYLNFE